MHVDLYFRIYWLSAVSCLLPHKILGFPRVEFCGLFDLVCPMH